MALWLAVVDGSTALNGAICGVFYPKTIKSTPCIQFVAYRAKK